MEIIVGNIPKGHGHVGTSLTTVLTLVKPAMRNQLSQSWVTRAPFLPSGRLVMPRDWAYKLLHSWSA